MTSIERKELIRRIRTPLPPQEAYELRRRGTLRSPIKYRTCRESFRTPDGKRLCDLVYDTDTEVEIVSFKQGKEYYSVPFEAILERFNEMKEEDPEKRVS